MRGVLPLFVFPRAETPFSGGSSASSRALVWQSGSMSTTSCTLRTRKFMTNRLLARRQFVSARLRITRRGRKKTCAFCRRSRKARGRQVSRRVVAGAWCWRRFLCLSPLPQILDVLHPGRANVPKVRPDRKNKWRLF